VVLTDAIDVSHDGLSVALELLPIVFVANDGFFASCRSTPDDV